MGIEHQALMNASFCIFPRFYAASVVKQFPFRTGTRTRGPSAERAKHSTCLTPLTKVHLDTNVSSKAAKGFPPP